MWPRRPEPALDRETVDGIIMKLMEIDAKLDDILDHLGLLDDEEDGEDDA